MRSTSVSRIHFSIGEMFQSKHITNLRTIVLLLWCGAIFGGCASSNWVKLRQRPNSPLSTELQFFSWRGPKPTARTEQFLRRYGLTDRFKGDPRHLLSELEEIINDNPSPENVYAYAELAYIGGRRLHDDGKIGEALDLYSASVAQSYEYLIGDRLQAHRNPYDPLFRRASDIYNGGLENALRIVRDQGNLRPGTIHTVDTPTQKFEIRIVARGQWDSEEFERMEFVTDYEIQGLQNHYQTFGLGVPLIAVHSGSSKQGAARYYSPNMGFPVTAFLRVLPESTIAYADGKPKHICMLELFDPLQHDHVHVNNQLVPLETDLTTPLAFSLNDKTFRKANVATRGFLNVEKSREVQGLYMLEPFDENKVPVIMIHGLWSNLVTWMEMFNDLRGSPDIRDNYQFWFYLYPTGQPFWVTAGQFRKQLAEAQNALDPKQQNLRFNHKVLVGHSMGGLISRMQTIASSDGFWNMIANQPLEQVNAPEEVREEMRQMLFFEPNRSIQRVITIASPNRGSSFSNNATQWLSRKLIRFPKALLQSRETLFRSNENIFKQDVLTNLATSVDTLNPDSPLLQLLMNAERGSWVRYNNIVGLLDENGVLSKGDGVVTYESAHLDFAESEVTVEADHVNIHRQPKTVLEVQRILLQHLDQVLLAERNDHPRPKMSRLPSVEGRTIELRH